MGQKVHPYGFRLGIINGWQSNWFAERGFAQMLHEGFRLAKGERTNSTLRQKSLTLLPI